MRKAARKLLRSIGKLRLAIRSSRRPLSRRLAAVLEAAAGPAYAPIFDLYDAVLAAAEEELTEAEVAYARDQILAGEARRDRDHAAAALRDLHAPLVRLLAAHPGLGSAGVVDGTPESPFALERQAELTIAFLRDFARRPPSPDRGVTIDAAGLATGLEEARRRLETALAAVTAANSEVKFARVRADEAFARADRALSNVARAFDSLEGLTHEGDFVARVRS